MGTLDHMPEGPCRNSGSQLNFQHCPVCGSDGWKLYVNPDTGFWFCHAGQHQGGGRMEISSAATAAGEGVRILEMMSDRRDDHRESEIIMPECGPLTKAARRYLHRRGIDDAEIKRRGLVEWENQHRVLIPYISYRGVLEYYNGRRYSENLGTGPKYLTAPGKHPLYVPNRGSTGRKLVITEGPFDAMAVARCSPHRAVALGGKSLPRYLRSHLRDEAKRVMMLEEVVIALDDGAINNAIHLSMNMPPGISAPVRLAVMPPGEDPASLDPQTLASILEG